MGATHRVNAPLINRTRPGGYNQCPMSVVLTSRERAH